MQNKRNSEAPKGTRATKQTNQVIQPSQLRKLFELQLEDIYWAEKALTKAIPEMIKQATSTDLKKTLTQHLKETEVQLERLNEVFEIVDRQPKATKCEAMAGLISEAKEIMEDCEAGAMRDAGIIAAAQKVEHYEIASYGTLRQFCDTLGFSEATDLLQETLDEEKAANNMLTKIALGKVNQSAASESSES